MTKITNNKEHWTEVSSDNYRYRVSSDFINQVDEQLEAQSMSRSILAKKMGITEGRVSQVFNNPGNLTLKSMIGLARNVGMKVSVLAYDDGDPENLRGPVNSQVFVNCWNELGKPHDQWSFQDSVYSYHEGVKSMVFSQVFGNVFDTNSVWNIASHIIDHKCTHLDVSDGQISLDLIEEPTEKKKEDQTMVSSSYGLAA